MNSFHLRSSVFICGWISFLSAQVPVITQKSATVQSETIPLKGLDQQHQYSLLYSLSTPPDGTVSIEIHQGANILASKTLHQGDADFYAQFRLANPGPASVLIKSSAAPNKYQLQINQWPLSPI